MTMNKKPHSASNISVKNYVQNPGFFDKLGLRRRISIRGQGHV